MVKAEVFGIWLAVAILFHVSITIMLQQPPVETTAVDAKAALKQNRHLKITPESPAGVVQEWLDGVHSGYGVLFTPALEDYGVEGLKDLAELASTDRNELDKLLTAAGHPVPAASPASCCFCCSSAILFSAQSPLQALWSMPTDSAAL